MSFCTSKVDISDQKNENFDKKMMFPKSIGNQSGGSTTFHGEFDTRIRFDDTNQLSIQKIAKNSVCEKMTQSTLFGIK